MIICSRTTWQWLYKLAYKYKNVCKNVFVDGHKPTDVSEDHKIFLEKMKELKPYIVEFDELGVIKPKVYPPDCTIGGDNQWLVIIITHNKYKFLANDRVCKV